MILPTKTNIGAHFNNLKYAVASGLLYSLQCSTHAATHPLQFLPMLMEGQLWLLTVVRADVE